jgi:molybdopterin molybdotransferase
MLTPQEALELVIGTALSLPPCAVALEQADGLAAAEDVVSPGDCPSFARAMMDGFAVRLADAGATVRLAGQLPAGAIWDGELVAGRCVEILTGAACPPGTDAVVPKEQADRGDRGVAVPCSIKPGQNIAPPGSDCRRGQRVVAAGETLTGMAVAALASFGLQSVRVTPRPSLAIIATGGELASPGQPLRLGQIHDSNGPMLRAMARQQGVSKVRVWQAADRLDAITAALDEASELDIVVLSGGVSVGAYDLVPEALARHGTETVFHGVKQKPGKPLLFARKERRLFFGLPGNPLACHLGFHRYVAAAARKMSGRPAWPQPFQGQLTAAIESKGGRTHFLPGRAEPAADPPAGWRVEVLGGASSADIFRGCRANCYVELPPAARTCQAGDICSFTWLLPGPWSP